MEEPMMDPDRRFNSDSAHRNAVADQPEPPPTTADVDPAMSDGLGDQPETPILSLPPLADEIAGYPLSPYTGEPVRHPVVLGSMVAFGMSALVALCAYWWYWWRAITLTNYATSAHLIELFNPRPGSGSSVVLACVLAVIGLIMVGGPAVAAYNVWHGASFSRIVGLVAVGTGLLAFFVVGLSWLALPPAAIGAGLLWTRPARAFVTAWQSYANPPKPRVEPYRDVVYGPAPRFR